MLWQRRRGLVDRARGGRSLSGEYLNLSLWWTRWTWRTITRRWRTRSRRHLYYSRLYNRLTWLAANVSLLITWTRLNRLLNAQIDHISRRLHYRDSFDNVRWWRWQTSGYARNTAGRIGRHGDHLTSQHGSFVLDQTRHDLIHLLQQLWIVQVNLIRPVAVAALISIGRWRRLATVLLARVLLLIARQRAQIVQVQLLRRQRLTIA